MSFTNASPSGGFGRDRTSQTLLLIGLAAVAAVFDEIKKFAGLVADGGEKGEIGVGIVAVEIGVAGLIADEAAIEQFGEGAVPGVAHGGWWIGGG